MWAASRAALRRILGSYLGVRPEHVAIEHGPNGKPRLAPGSGADLRFNLSHSCDVALIAVRLGHEVGVDVERRRPGVDWSAIARLAITEFAGEGDDDAVRVAESPDPSGFRWWTRHEARAKATARGIVYPTRTDDAARFAIRDLDGIPGCAAALASEGSDWSVRRFRESPTSSRSFRA